MATAPIFDRLYDRYDSWYERNRVLAELEVRAVREAIEGLKGPALEVGVGTGFFASRLGVDYGVDPALNMLKVAKMRGVEVFQGVGERLPIRSNSLGYVLLVVTICFVDDPHTVIAEAARVVRPGGAVVACIVPADSPWGRHYVEKGRRGHPFYSVARFYTFSQVASMLRDVGLVVDKVAAVISKPPGSPIDPEEKPAPVYRGQGFVCIRGRKSL